MTAPSECHQRCERSDESGNSGCHMDDVGNTVEWFPLRVPAESEMSGYSGVNEVCGLPIRVRPLRSERRNAEDYLSRMFGFKWYVQGAVTR